MFVLRKHLYVVLFLISAPLLYTNGIAQSLSNDSTFSNRALAYATKLYTQSVRNQALLYNGSDYKAWPRLTTTHPYFESNGWERGAIDYNGESYDDVPLMYDLVRDEVLLDHYDQQGYEVPLRLAQEKVKSFIMRNHLFIRLSVNPKQSGAIHSGFYDLLYDGTIQVLAKRKKLMFRELSTLEVKLKFDYKVNYLIYKNGVYYPVKNKHSVIKVLGDKKEKINRLAAKNKVNFSANKEAAIVKLAGYYDQP